MAGENARVEIKTHGEDDTFWLVAYVNGFEVCGHVPAASIDDASVKVNRMEDTKDDQPPLALTDLLGRLSVMRLRATNCLRSGADTSGVRRALKDVGELCQAIELLEESRSRWMRAATTQFEMLQKPSNGDVGRAIAVVGRAGLYDQEKLGLQVTE